MRIDLLKRIAPHEITLQQIINNQGVSNGMQALIHEFASIYQAEMHPAPVNLYCGTCIMAMVKDLYNEFQKKKHLLTIPEPNALDLGNMTKEQIEQRKAGRPKKDVSRN